MKSCLEPVVDTRTRVLILGSLPGERSLAEGRYYAHPRNQFWRLVGVAIGAEVAPFDYPAVLDAGVGLWDVIASAERAGSLDSAIRNARPNALAELVATLPALRAVAFNGGKAAAVGRAQLRADTPCATIALPSSSPAHARPFAEKAAAWRRLADYLA